jgi:hypothetical protein
MDFHLKVLLITNALTLFITSQLMVSNIKKTRKNKILETKLGNTFQKYLDIFDSYNRVIERVKSLEKKNVELSRNIINLGVNPFMNLEVQEKDTL